MNDTIDYCCKLQAVIYIGAAVLNVLASTTRTWTQCNSTKDTSGDKNLETFGKDSRDIQSPETSLNQCSANLLNLAHAARCVSLFEDDHVSPDSPEDIVHSPAGHVIYRKSYLFESFVLCLEGSVFCWE